MKKRIELFVGSDADIDDSSAREYWLAHQAARKLAATMSMREFQQVLETFDDEPLDCLYHFLGSYLEDRRHRGDAFDFDNEPF
jgi:hypothetical protein